MQTCDSPFRNYFSEPPPQGPQDSECLSVTSVRPFQLQGPSRGRTQPSSLGPGSPSDPEGTPRAPWAGSAPVPRPPHPPRLDPHVPPPPPPLRCCLWQLSLSSAAETRRGGRLPGESRANVLGHYGPEMGVLPLCFLNMNTKTEVCMFTTYTCWLVLFAGRTNAVPLSLPTAQS